MKISQLKIKANNPRKIDAPQIEKLMQSIKDFPKMMELRPIVYDPVTMEVLGGNQRLSAIKKLGMKDIPDNWTRSADTLTEDEKRRFVIQDNHQSGDWDFDVLSSDWSDFDLDGLGIVMPDLTDSDMEYNNLHEEILEGVEFFSVTFTIQNKHKDKFEEIGKKAIENAILEMLK